MLLAYLVAGDGVVRLAASAGGAGAVPDLGGGLAGQVLGLLFAFNLGAMVWRASMKANWWGAVRLGHAVERPAGAGQLISSAAMPARWAAT